MLVVDGLSTCYLGQILLAMNICPGNPLIRNVPDEPSAFIFGEEIIHLLQRATFLQCCLSEYLSFDPLEFLY